MNKILVVEDNELNLKLFVDILKYQNFDVDTAKDGNIAYNKIKNNNYNLVILDIQLPELDGFSMLKKLQEEKFKYPPVIITSACVMDSDKVKAKEFNVSNYITKPIDINNFVITVKKTLNKG